MEERNEIIQLDQRIKKIEEDISKDKNYVEQLSSYTGGDMTGIEYMHMLEVGHLYSGIFRKLSELCALKLKKMAISFYGRKALEEFDETAIEGVSATVGSIFSFENNLTPERLNEALDGAADDGISINKMQQPCVVIDITNNRGQIAYEFSLRPDGMDVEDVSAKEKNDL